MHRFGAAVGGAIRLPTVTIRLAQLAYVTIMILVIFTPIALLSAIKVFASFMAVALIIQMTRAILIQKEMKAVE